MNNDYPMSNGLAWLWHPTASKSPVPDQHARGFDRFGASISTLARWLRGAR
jgi:hypothetical protein